MIVTEHFVQLNQLDNILVCRKTAAKGTEVNINGIIVPLIITIEVGHKIACCEINEGEKVYKYGAAIGSAVKFIAVGEHVHLTNLKSDYIDSHTRKGLVANSRIIGQA